MKKLTVSIVAAILAFLVSYLLGAFINASFNITDWPVMGRLLIGVFGLFCSFWVFGSIYYEQL